MACIGMAHVCAIEEQRAHRIAPDVPLREAVPAIEGRTQAEALHQKDQMEVEARE